MKELVEESDYSQLKNEVAMLRKEMQELKADRSKRLSGSVGGLWRRFARRHSWAWLRIAVAVLLALGLLSAQNKPDALFIASNGNVGIGSTSPAQKLDVAGTVRSSSGGFQFPDNSMQITAAIIPSGAVISFNLDACPSGWSDYAPAYGRFIRGIDKSGSKIDADGLRRRESKQEDAIRNITGSLSGVIGASNRAWPWGFHPGEDGAFSVIKNVDTYNRYNGDYQPEGGIGTKAVFNASRAPNVLTAPENRPRNVALLYCQKN